MTAPHPRPDRRRAAARWIAAAIATGVDPVAIAATVPPPANAPAPAASASVAATAPPAAAAPAASAGFAAWSEALAADWVRLAPEWATLTQYFDGAEQAALDRRLTPRTVAARDRRVALARDGLARLARFDPATLSREQRLEAATLRVSLQRAIDGERWADHGFAFDQRSGPHVRLVDLLSGAHPLRHADDVNSWLARLREVDLRIDETIARARDAAARGLLPPRFIAERAREQVVAFLRPAAADNVFVGALAQRSRGVAGWSAADRGRAIETATAIVDERVRPAYRRVLALLDELLPRTGDDAGLWRLPDGAAAYAHALAANTTTDLDADRIHAIGLREVARIEAEMDRVLVAMGRTGGSVDARLRALRDALQPPAEPDPRPALLARYAAYVADAQRRAEPLFGLTPAAPVEVRRVPPLTEPTASAHYTTPAPDGSRPGIFWVPLRGAPYNVPGMRTLAVHEAVPGHHFQLAIQQERRDLPRWRQRRIFGGGSAHSEGWALYAERLAIEHGWYDEDPASLLGALDAQRFRARRLVADTGLHARRWTRQQAIDYGIPVSEVERYVANPGQATAYFIGMLHLLALRDEARAALGERFSLPAFHDVVLKAGSLPLDVLSMRVRDWIADAEAGAASPRR